MQVKLDGQKCHCKHKQLQTDSKYFNVTNAMTRGGAEGERIPPISLEVEHVKLHRKSLCQNSPKCKDKKLQTDSEGSKYYNDLKGMIKGIEEERVLVFSLEKEVRHMLSEMYFKEKQLLDMNDLIGVLVRKLFHVYKNITLVEGIIRTCVHEGEITALKKKIAGLEEENRMMKQAIIDAKNKLMTLEQKAETYLEERDNIQRKHNESLSLIETLQKENARSSDRLETLQEDANSTLSDLQRDMIKELECCERTNRESIDKIDTLRNELEKTKREHSKSVQQIAALSEENRAQLQKISSLNAALEAKQEKPKTKSVCIGSSEGRECKANVAVNVPSSSLMKNVAVENVPKMHNASTMLDEMERQIIQTCAPAPLEMEPRFYTPPRRNSPPRLSLPTKCNSPRGNSPPCTPKSHPRCPNKQVAMDEPGEENGEFIEQPRPKRKMGMKAPIMGERPIRLVHEPKLHDVLVASPNLESCSENLCEAEDAMDAIQAATQQHFDVDVGQLPFFIPYTSNDFVGSASEKEIQRIVRTEILNNATRDVAFTGENLLPGTDLDLALYTDMRTNRDPDCIADCNISAINVNLRKPADPPAKIARADQACPGSPYATARSDQTSHYATGHTNIFDQSIPYRTARSDQTSHYTTATTNTHDQNNHYRTARADQTDHYTTGCTNLDETTMFHMAPSNWDDFSSDSSEVKLNDCCQKAVEKTMKMEKLKGLHKATATGKATKSQKVSTAAEDFDVDAQRRDWAKYKSSLKSHRKESSSHASRDSNATDDLHNVVHDLNESVSRIMKKSTDDKASRGKIAQLEEQLRMIRNKDEMINVQSDTLNIVQIELQALKQKEQEVEAERRKRGQEVENLKMTIREMEKALVNSQERSKNLQKAVDLYMNSINVLEGSEERWRTEIAQQRITIANLQEALVATKHQLEELQQRGAVDADMTSYFQTQEKYVLIQFLDANLRELEKYCVHYYELYTNAAGTIEYLRDINLEIEVEKFDLVQDVSVLESRLLKYQQMYTMQKCVCGLKIEVRKLRQQKKYHETLIKFLKKELKECGYELSALKLVLETEGVCQEQENEALSNMVRDLENLSCGLRCEVDVLDSALIREKKISKVQSDRIEELQVIIGAKNIEACRCNDAYQDVKQKLEMSIEKNKKLESSISELQKRVNACAMQHAMQEEETDICHGELDVCLDNLQDVKLKMRMQNQMLNQKVQECTKLQADYKIQFNNAEITKRDLENLRIRYRDEVIELKHAIRELKDKLANSENRASLLNDETKQVQAMLVEAVQRETQQQKEHCSCEQDLNEKLQKSQSEEMRLIELVTQLEQELVIVRNDMAIRDQHLEKMKGDVIQMKNDDSRLLSLAQDEINGVKNEINVLVQQQAEMKHENDQLQEQLQRLKCCLQQHETRNTTLKDELDRCLSEIQTINVDKVYLEQKNEQLSRELERLQGILHCKTASVVNLEMELVEAKTTKEELCVESRNVVSSVKAWLEEQKLINLQLKDKLQKKNAIIAKYEQERASGPDRCCGCYPRQRAGTINQRQIRMDSPPPVYNAPWSIGSRGSGSESPNSSVSSAQADWYDYGDAEYNTVSDESNPRLWLHRVESMTEELQRSNRYWKKKINDNEFMVTKDK